MSFDIVIANPHSANARDGGDPPARGRVATDSRGRPGSAAGALVDESCGPLRRKHTFTCRDQTPAEHEDLPFPIQQVLRGRVFLLEMNLPWDLAERDMEEAEIRIGAAAD